MIPSLTVISVPPCDQFCYRGSHLPEIGGTIAADISLMTFSQLISMWDSKGFCNNQQPDHIDECIHRNFDVTDRLPHISYKTDPSFNT